MASRANITAQEENYFNPIRLHIKKTTSNRLKPEATPHTAHAKITNHSEKELRFKDLSKDRPEYYTQKQSEKSFSQILKKQTKLDGVRKRLFDNEPPTTSREKSLSFSEVIRMSREKRLRESSSRASMKKEEASGKKEGRAFNALKARLLGENNPNASNIIKPNSGSTIKPPIRPPLPKNSSESRPSLNSAQPNQLDMVRISTQLSSECLNASLEMTPL